MTFKPNLNIGNILSNKEIGQVFKCGNMGGMRKSNRTDTLVLVTDHTKGLYEDRWEGDILHYTGMGKNGNQDLNFAQNKTLNESNMNSTDVFLFEVAKAREYTYLGEVILIDKPYQEEQIGDDGNLRYVWIFPLKVKASEEASTIAEDLINKSYLEKTKKANRYSTDKIKELAEETGKTNVPHRSSTVKSFIRNPYVGEYARRRANGTCELCDLPAPFQNKEKKPYLEVHHIEWLSKGGEDTIENTVALCPNCHRKMHIVDSLNDVQKLKRVAKYFF